MDNKELEIKHLIALRNNYFSMFMLISSGVAGLFFTDFNMTKSISLTLAGVFFACLFLSKFLNINIEIKTILKRR